MKKTLADCAEEVLMKANQPMTPGEIWQEIEKSGGYSSDGKTPGSTLAALLYREANSLNSNFLKTETKPARFSLKPRNVEIKHESTADTEKAAKRKTVKHAAKKSSYEEKEKKLHPLLAYFAFKRRQIGQNKEIVTKTIAHEKSKKSGYNEWVHPDMVGAYIPVEDWAKEIVDFAQSIDSAVIKSVVRLYSFELKVTINKANYRESFFQAVSNSSWAHEGYLVAAEIAPDKNLASELRRLSSSFGIGIIDLDLKNPDSWSILYPATSKSNLDWETMNKLCQENKDFKRFLKNVQDGFNSKEIHPYLYDDIVPDLDKYMKEKKLR